MKQSAVKTNLIVTKGNPLPAVYWWKGAQRVDADYFVVNNSISRNVLTLANLTRDDLLMTLTCQAYNTNLTEAVSQTITLDLYRKCLAMASSRGALSASLPVCPTN